MKKKIGVICIVILIGCLAIGLFGCNPFKPHTVDIDNQDNYKVVVRKKNSSEIKSGEEVDWGTVLVVEIEPQSNEKYNIIINGFKKPFVDNRASFTVRGKTKIEIERVEKKETKKLFYSRPVNPYKRYSFPKSILPNHKNPRIRVG